MGATSIAYTALVELPPGPSLRPMWTMVRWLRSPLPMLDEFAATYGNAFSLRVPRMEQPMVFFSDPAAIKDIWGGDPETMRAGEANVILRAALGPGSLLLMDGAEHLRERRLMLPPFHGDRMRAYGATMRDVTLRELAHWPVDKTFPIHSSMQAITLDVIMQTIFGAADEALHDALVRWTTLATSRLGTAILLLVPPEHAKKVQALATNGLGRFLPWAPIVRAQRDTDRLVRDMIARRRREDTTNRSDILSMLLAARDEHGQPMTDDELRDEMLTLLLAGHETTATTLAWAIHHLLENPAWLARVRAEVDEVVGVGGQVTTDHLEKLVLLDAAIKETLRRTPIVPLVGRVCKQPTTINGYELPVGAVACASIYLAHHRPDLWPDPTRFDPSRFVNKKPDPTHYFPFGGGTRRCLGMAFATYEMKVVLATILAHVDLKAAPNTRVRLVRRGITLAPSGGMPVIIRRR
jgi:cytochrome P450